MKQKLIKYRETFESELSNALRFRSISHFFAIIFSIEIMQFWKYIQFWALRWGRSQCNRARSGMLNWCTRVGPTTLVYSVYLPIFSGKIYLLPGNIYFQKNCVYFPRKYIFPGKMTKKSKNRRKFKNRQSPWFMGRESWFGLRQAFASKTLQRIQNFSQNGKSGKRTDPNQDSLPLNPKNRRKSKNNPKIEENP